jgi:hypothetical protein
MIVIARDCLPTPKANKKKNQRKATRTNGRQREWEYVLRIPFVRGLNDEKGPMRRVETTRRGFEATEFDESL